MPHINLHIPLHLTEQKIFLDPGLPSQPLFGYPAKIKVYNGYFYLELTNVPRGKAAAVLERACRCLKWASVRLDIGILTDQEPLKHSHEGGFNGQFATAYPSAPIQRFFAPKQPASCRSHQHDCWQP